jgi:CDP-glycerol glycerophosphotransferase (TagB/SpsB family)
MPTWRSWLAGRYKKKTRGERFRNPEFMRSNYALRWLEFLQSRRLQGLLDAAGYRLVFFTHASVQPYVEAFRRASLFPIMTHQDAPIQDLFKRAALLITDFSSAAFEMAVLRKGALHYQFDRDEVFSGKHLTLPGYFDYARDGFGPIAEELDDLLDKLDALLARDCLPDPLYQSRIDKAITFRDGKNCERVCEAILALEKKA